MADQRATGSPTSAPGWRRKGELREGGIRQSRASERRRRCCYACVAAAARYQHTACTNHAPSLAPSSLVRPAIRVGRPTAPPCPKRPPIKAQHTLTPSSLPLSFCTAPPSPCRRPRIRRRPPPRKRLPRRRWCPQPATGGLAGPPRVPVHHAIPVLVRARTPHPVRGGGAPSAPPPACWRVGGGCSEVGRTMRRRVGAASAAAATARVQGPAARPPARTSRRTRRPPRWPPPRARGTPPARPSSA